MFYFLEIIYYLSYLVFPFVILIGYFFFKRKSFKERLAAIALLLLGGFFIYARFIEPKIINVKYEKLSDFDYSLKTVVFSDNHIGLYNNGVSLEKIVERVNEIEPDIVFVPGDFIYYIDEKDIEKELEPFSFIEAPVYAVTGNHDEGKKSKNYSAQIKAALEKYNVQCMDNKIERTKIKDENITIVGLSDLWSAKTDFSLLDKVSPEENVIVLSHNPDSVYYFPERIRNNVDLVISGHTHGGQIRLPWVYKYVIPTRYDFDSGFYDIEGIKVYVTSGIGMTGLPFRFLVPPEIVVLE